MSTHTPMSTPALRLALVAVALLSGILAMHAVAGGPHSAGVAGHSPSASDVSHVPTHGLHEVAASVVEAVPLDAVMNLAAGVSAQQDAPPGDAASSVLACVAMLFSALFIRGRQPQSSATRHKGGPAHALVPRGEPSRGTRPPDLLTELCVMRT